MPALFANHVCSLPSMSGNWRLHLNPSSGSSVCRSFIPPAAAYMNPFHTHTSWMCFRLNSLPASLATLRYVTCCGKRFSSQNKGKNTRRHFLDQHADTKVKVMGRYIAGWLWKQYSVDQYMDGEGGRIAKHKEATSLFLDTYMIYKPS